MARRTSGRSRSASKASRPSNAPAPVKASPPAMTGSSSSGVLGGLVSVIVDGMAWGGANAIAHRVVDAIMGPRVVRVDTITASPAPAPASHAAPNVATSDACVTQSKAFEDCLNASGTDIGHCQFYMDMLTKCRNAASSSSAASVVFSGQ